MTRGQKIKHNKAIKELYGDYLHNTFKSLSDQESKNYSLRMRFHTLYFADQSFEYCTLESLKIMVLLNYKLAYMKTFGLKIKIDF